MSEQSTEDARLSEAFARQQLEDTRPLYRQRLRRLRERDATAFDRALRHYEEVVLPALGAGNAVEAWVEYGRWLAELDGPGRLLAIDPWGRATPYSPPPTEDALILHVPEDPRAPVLATRVPAAPSPSQQATYDLLVLERVELERG
jgi:hypothetical protein